MAFDLRCPSCKAKLRFDEAPERGELIDCPKCMANFPAPSKAALEEKKAEEAKKPTEEVPKNAPKKIATARPRTFFNHWLLFLIVGGIMSIITVTLMVIWIVVAASAKAEDMLAAVPENCNVIRGVNVKAMKNVKNLKSEQDKFYNADAQAAFAAVAAQGGIDKENLAYFVAAQEAKASGTIYMFNTTKDLDVSKLGNGQPTSLPGANGAMVVCPNRQMAIVCFNAGGAESSVLTRMAENSKSRPKDGMHKKVGNVGRMAIRSQVWTIIRPTGSLQGYLGDSAVAIKDDSELGKLRDAMAKATVLATWTSFGSGGVRFGAGMELPSSDEAKDLVANMKKGPLGKGDESEPPNNFKSAMSFANPKQNGEFFQYLDYKQRGECAYLITKTDKPDKAQPAMDEFNKMGRPAVR